MRRLSACILVSLLATVACGDKGPSAPELFSLEISPGEIVLSRPGEVVNFALSATTADGRVLTEAELKSEGASVTWSVSDPSVVRHLQGRGIEALAEGVAWVQASAMGVAVTASVEVVFPDAVYGGAPTSGPTGLDGVAVIETSAGSGLAVTLRDHLGSPLAGSIVEYSETGRGVAISVSHPGRGYVPTLLLAPLDALLAAAGPAATVGEEQSIITLVGMLIVVGALTWAQLEFIDNAYEIQQFYWELDPATQSQCFTYAEIADLMKARTSAAINLASIGLTFAGGLVAAGSTTVTRAVHIAGEWVQSETTLGLADRIQRIGYTEFGFSASKDLARDKVKVKFEFVDRDRFGARLRNIWANFQVFPDDPSCGPVVPGRPTLTAPSNGAAGLSRSVTLRWQGVEGATRYRWQVGEDSDFNRLAAQGSTASTTGAAYLSHGRTYFWRVRAENSAGEGDWSSVRRFSTAASPSPTVAVHVPAGSQSGTIAIPYTLSNPSPARMDLRVTGGSYGQALYRMTLSGTSVGRTVQRGSHYYIEDVPAGTHTFYWNSAVDLPGQDLDWFISIHSTDGDLIGYSQAVRVDNSGSAPGQVRLDAPIDGSISTLTAGGNVRHEWSTASRASTYRIEVARDPSMSVGVISLDDIAQTYAFHVNPLPSTTYYWRVRGSNQHGHGPWSAIWSYTTPGPSGVWGERGQPARRSSVALEEVSR